MSNTHTPDFSSIARAGSDSIAKGVLYPAPECGAYGFAISVNIIPFPQKDSHQLFLRSLLIRPVGKVCISAFPFRRLTH